MRNSRGPVALVAAVFMLAGAATMASLGEPRQQDAALRLPDWISIAGQSCADMTASQARASLQDWVTEQRRKDVLLVASPPTGPRRMWKVKRGALGSEPDVDRMIADAFRIVEAEGFWDRVGRWFGRREPVDVTPVWLVHAERLAAYLRRNVEAPLKRDAKPARFVLQGGKPRVIADVPGLALDTKEALRSLNAALRDPAVEEAELPLKTMLASVTAEEAAGIERQIAEFQTHYSERGNRRRNLEVACARINGTIIKPGGVFSYNEVVGPRDAENGFKLAPVIVRGRMEPGMGGGVCQVSTTVYNAGLLAGLDVVSRTHHAFPVHYVPAGRDATVVYGAIDLKMRNSTGSPIGFIADGSNGYVRMRIYGKPNPGLSVGIERSGISSWAPTVQTVSDRSLPVGKSLVRDKGRSGHRVSVWRVFREGGRVIRRELVSRDVYRAFPRVVAVGAAVAPAPATAPTAPVQPAPGDRPASQRIAPPAQ